MTKNGDYILKSFFGLIFYAVSCLCATSAYSHFGSVNKTADIISITSEKCKQTLVCDSSNELKDDILQANHIAVVVNIISAISIMVFLVARAIRDLFRCLGGKS